MYRTEMKRRIFPGAGILSVVGVVGLFLLTLFPVGASFAEELHPDVRVKDLVNVEGVRPNQLIGMGLVVGLQGTGDKGDLALRMMQNMARQFGVAVDTKAIKSKNAAVVTVTCELPAFARPGQTVDVGVSAMGDAKSLQGGVLLQTPLQAADGKVYAVAQGPLLVGGFAAGGQGAQVTKNITTTGRVAGGAIVERDVPMAFAEGGRITLLLRNPDFTTAQRVAEALNRQYGNIAAPVDATRVAVVVPPAFGTNPTQFLAEVEGLRVRPDTVARVVVNERSGTVVMGGDVRIGSVAVAHGNLTVRVQERQDVSQPQPFSRGETTVTTQTDVSVQEQPGQLLTLPAATSVNDLVKSMNGVGASPRDIIAILQAIQQAGALHGELVVM
ncbi:flagellar basal body P-ring protein FlgI [Aminiphilus circumscriptus]|uniref:flagellar basal body P-ring protein FlgI n=1 Tax=Aminiphilus circumscriptus TaxID=290732 RepID=UPI0004AF4A46|nr:flagellar basal body P-ring protein FlgI [Aminiphilus circumscriptus]